MTPARLRSLFLATAAVVLLGAAAYRLNTSGVMSDAANALLNSLHADQKAKAVFDFNDEERLNWHFIPRVRKGLPLKAMSHDQRALAHALLSTGLSQQGYVKATSIMSLEEILKVIEGDYSGRRDPENYFFSIFGTPSDSGTWGFRVEGHHLALNFTVVKGKVASSPMFYGTNPAEVRVGPRKGLRVLAREDDLGRAVYTSLAADQQKVALVSKAAYKDIFTMADRKAALNGQPSGLSAAKMNAKQRQALQELIDEYIYNAPEPLAAARLDQVKKAGANLYFAWAGTAEKGGPHYYRVQGATFLIEYDNTQNDANHIHSVWRDYNGDFGQDLLGGHYKSSH